MGNYYRLLHACDKHNYWMLVDIAVKDIVDPVTGVRIMDVIGDAKENNGSTELGDLRNALSEYYRVYFDFYDAAYPRMLSEDTLRASRGLPSRVDMAVEFKLASFKKCRAEEENDLLSVDRIESVSPDKTNLVINYPVYERSERPEFWERTFHPGVVAMNRYGLKKHENGYSDGEVSLLVDAYYDRKLTGAEDKAAVDYFIESMVDAGFLTAEGEITPKYVKKMTGRASNERN